MKTRRKIRVDAMLGGLMLCLLMVLACPGMKSEAASKKPTCAKTQTVYMTKSEHNGYMTTKVSGPIYIKNLSSTAEITDIKSSNSKIWVANRFNIVAALRYKGLWVAENGCKPGAKSKISFKVRQNGKIYSLSCTVTMKEETACFKSFKIGGKNYASQLAGYHSKKLKLTKKKTKLTIKMKPGIKLTEIELTTKSGRKVIKNGATVKLNKGDVISIDYQYTKKPKNYSPCLYKNNKDCYLKGSTTIGVE